MKKLLLGTTALATAGMIAATAPMAADPIQVTIDGYFQSYLVLGNWDNVQVRTPSNLLLTDTTPVPAGTVIGRAKHKPDYMKLENEIRFNGRTKLDNGMVVGFRVELEGYTSGDQLDEYYIFFSGDWGRIEYGATDDVDRKMVYSAPSALPGHGFGTHNIFSGLSPLSNNDAGRVGGGPAATATTSSNTGDANKLSYFTPRFGGFQFGVNYIAGWEPGNGNVCYATGGYSLSYGSCANDIRYDRGLFGDGGTSTNSSNLYRVLNRTQAYEYGVTLAMNFLQKFNNVDVALFAAYHYSEVQQKGMRVGALGTGACTGFPGTSSQACGDNNAGTTGAAVVSAIGSGLTAADYKSWAIGGQMGFQGFTIGGGLGRDNNGLSGNNETWWYTASARYVTGPWAFSAGWFGSRRDEYRRAEFLTVSNTGGGTVQVNDIGQNGKDKFDYYEVAASYAMGPGITLAAGVMWNMYDGQTKNEKVDSWQFVFGTTFAF